MLILIGFILGVLFGSVAMHHISNHREQYYCTNDVFDEDNFNEFNL